MEQHDYIVLLEKFFKKEASSEERRILAYDNKAEELFSNDKKPRRKRSLHIRM